MGQSYDMEVCESTQTLQQIVETDVCVAPLFYHLVVPKHIVELIVLFLSPGTVAVDKALVWMKPLLCTPGLGTHHQLNYPKVCLSKGYSCSLTSGSRQVESFTDLSFSTNTMVVNSIYFLASCIFKCILSF